MQRGKYVLCPLCWRVIHSSKLTVGLQKKDCRATEVAQSLRDIRFQTVKKQLRVGAYWDCVMSTKKLHPKVYFNNRWPLKICPGCRAAIDSGMFVAPPRFYIMASPGPLKQLTNAVWRVERRRLVEKYVNEKLGIIFTGEGANTDKIDTITRSVTKRAWHLVNDEKYRRTTLGNTFRRYPKKVSGHARRAFATCIVDGTVSNQQALWMVAQVGALEDRLRFMYVYGLVEDMFTRFDIAGKVPRCICDRSLDILDIIEYFGYGGVHPKRRNREIKYIRKLAVSVMNGVARFERRAAAEDSGINAVRVRAYSLSMRTLLNIFSKSHEYMISNVCSDYVECMCFGLDWGADQCFTVMVDILKNVLARAEVVSEPVTTLEFQKQEEKVAAGAAENFEEVPAISDGIVDAYPAESLRGRKFWQSNDYSLPGDRFLMQDGEHKDGLILRVVHNPSNQQEVGQTYTVSVDALSDYGDDYTGISWEVINEVKEQVHVTK